MNNHHARWGLNSLITGDGHQPNNRGLYTLPGTITYPFPTAELWADDVPFPVWWDMLVPGWPFPLHPKKKPRRLLTPGPNVWTSVRFPTKSPFCFFVFVGPSYYHLLYRHPILAAFMQFGGGSAWGPVKYMWMALESNQPGHPREGGDPSFKERPEFFTSNGNGYE